ncbi:MAG: VTT domain-containing protein [Clostridia bacterium]
MNKKKKSIIINIIILSVIFAAILFVSLKYLPQISKLVSEPKKFRDYLLTFGNNSVFVFIGIQALQVIIAAIPGEFVQIAGGYVYGTFLGTIYSFVGIFIGTVIVFGMIRLFGYSLIKVFISKKSIKKYDFILNSPKSEFVMLFLFLLPAIPKDIVTYLAGLTPIKPLKFFAIAMLGRLPTLVASTYIGSNVMAGNYIRVIVFASIGVIIFVAGVIFRDKIINIFVKKNKNDDTD